MSGFEGFSIGKQRDSNGNVSNPSGSGEYLEISVSDPQKHHESINSYITYNVNTNTNKTDFEFGQKSVIRRYNDFRWMHSQLVEHYPGCIVPPLPEKLVVGRFSPEFVETRRRNLEKFLQRVSQHPDLGYANAFRTFLQADDTVLQNEKLNNGGNNNTTATSPTGFLNLMNKSFTKAVTNVDIISHPDDTKVEEMITYVNKLDIQFQTVAKQSRALVSKNRELHQNLFDFGLSIVLLGQDEEGSVADGCKNLGHTADKLSVFTGQYAEKSALHFDDPISEYCRIIAAVKLAYQKRKEALSNYSYTKTDYENKKIKHSGMVAMGKEESKIRQGESKMHEASQALDESKKTFELINSRFLDEFARFQREKADDMKQTMVTFVKLQMDFHKQMYEELNDVLPKLDPTLGEDGESVSIEAKGFLGNKHDSRFIASNPLAKARSNGDNADLHSKPVSSIDSMSGEANQNNPFEDRNETLGDDDDDGVVGI